jgi:putative Mg2+ transporter-C (MgtC) family protein
MRLGAADCGKPTGPPRGIKAAAAVWITGAIGISFATSYWPLGFTVGAVTVAVMFAADRFPDPVREERMD